VFVTPLPEGETSLPTPSAPLERQVIIKEGPNKGLSLQGPGIPSLLVSGQGDELTNQARLRTGVVEGTHTPVGEATLYVDGDAVATLAGVKAHPLTFGLAGGGVSVGRNPASRCRRLMCSRSSSPGASSGAWSSTYPGRPTATRRANWRRPSPRTERHAILER
jgi:hypothetical protein